MNLDNIINQRIGFGAFQFRAFAIFSLIEIDDGVELTIHSFLNPIIKAIHPQATSSYISSLNSLFYFGMLLGSLLSGYLAGVYGRKNTLVLGTFVQLSISFLLFFADSLSVLLFFIFLQGFGLSFTWTLTNTLFTQVAPQKYRSKSLLSLNSCMSIGRLVGVGFGYIFLRDNLAETNWKLMIVCSSLPKLIVAISTQLLLTQSPCFLLVEQRFQQGFQCLNKMLEVNGAKDELTYYENSSPLVISESSISINKICSKKYLPPLIGLSLCFTFINFSFNGQPMVQALHLNRNTNNVRQGLSKYFLTILGQLPSLGLALYMIDHPSFGRKKSILLYFACSGLFHCLFAWTHFILMATFARFFMKCAIQLIYPLAAEIFDTKVRTTGFGISSGMGRIGSIIMPFILIPLDMWNQWAVYVLFGILSFLASIITLCLIDETMNKIIDNTTMKEEITEIKEVKDK